MLSPATPALSVVIASVNGWDVLGPTLSALDAQPERLLMEVIVVDRVGGETREYIKKHAPSVLLIEADTSTPTTIPGLRYQGVIVSTGALVAIVEDHGEVSPGWAAALIEAHQGPWGAVGGAVENGREGLVNWAAFLCEYTPYMGPIAEGEWLDLPGNNIAYKRDALMRHAGELKAGRWESWINAKLQAEGVKTASTNAAVVRHIKPFRLGEFLVQRFHFARSYAGMRRVDQSPVQRLIYGFGSAALPALLLARLARQALAKKVKPTRILAASPLVGLFFTVGAFGEMLGYLFGPGASLSRVE